MLSRKDVQLDLLRKLNELCEKANVRYALHGQAAFLAYKKEPIEYMSSLEVMMCQGDAEKIAGMLDDDMYYFEDFRSNPKFDMHFMMFGYKKSTDLKIKDLNFMKSRHIDNYCIRINIRFIEHPIERGFRKWIDLKSLLWKFRFMEITTGDLWYLNYFKKFINFSYGIIGDDKVANHRYDSKRKLYSIDTWNDIKDYEQVEVAGESLNPQLFYDVIPRKLDGVPSYILNNFYEYASSAFGFRWQEKKWSTSQSCTSSLISWEEFSKDEDFQKSVAITQQRFEYTYANSTNLEENMFLKLIKKFTYPKSSRIFRNLSLIKNMRKHVIQSGSIIQTRDEYIAQKDELLQLYWDGNYDELEMRMKPLIQSMENGMSLGYTYSIDEEMDHFLDSYLRNIGNEKLADGIKKFREDI